MRSLPPFPLTDVADAYVAHLFDPALRERLAHHISHVASENWLSMEFAYSFNKSKQHVGLPGWTAVLERQRVDVTLLPSPEFGRVSSSDQPIYIECKMAGPPYWGVWKEIALDLTGKQDSASESVKPVATYALCFLYDIMPQSVPTLRPATKERFRQYIQSVPFTPGFFTPHQHEDEFVLLHLSQEHLIEWLEPVPGSWQEGFSATMRILWLAKPHSY